MMPDNGAVVRLELWVSLASLLRSYTAAHGLNGNRQATVELGEEQIMVRHGETWLDLETQRRTGDLEARRWKERNAGIDRSRAIAQRDRRGRDGYGSREHGRGS